jgi:hypothetical protein
MSSKLKLLNFNLCGLESSYLANDDVLELHTQISKLISPALTYACIFWDNHLEHELLNRARPLRETSIPVRDKVSAY